MQSHEDLGIQIDEDNLSSERFSKAKSLLFK